MNEFNEIVSTMHQLGGDIQHSALKSAQRGRFAHETARDMRIYLNRLERLLHDVERNVS